MGFIIMFVKIAQLIYSQASQSVVGILNKQGTHIKL